MITKTIQIIFFVLSVGIVGCFGDGESEYFGYGVVQDDLCRNVGGTFHRCVDFVSGDCEESGYLAWRSLAPSESVYSFDAVSCGTHEGVWMGPQQLRGDIRIHRTTHITRSDRTEDWVILLYYDAELCFERYFVYYTTEGCGG